jgi:hypothetical protein
LGDILYSLPSLRATGGGHYYICERPWTKKILHRLNAILPLLEIQPCISGISTYAGEWIDYDLSTFRAGGLKYGDTIIERQARWIGAKVDISQPWLVTGDPDSRTFGKIVINRCPRWPGFHFPWRKIVEEFSGDAVFLGLESEHRDFVREFGHVSFIPTINLLEAANLIVGAALFIGNQSCPLAIAEGLHKRTIVECCCFALDSCNRIGYNIHVTDGLLDFSFNGRRFRSPSMAHVGLEIEQNLMRRAKSFIDGKRNSDIAGR